MCREAVYLTPESAARRSFRKKGLTSSSAAAPRGRPVQRSERETGPVSDRPPRRKDESRSEPMNAVAAYFPPAL